MSIREFNKQDFENLYSFMKPIWYETYDFLPKKQVEILLDKYFSKENVEKFVSLGYRYFKVSEVGVLVFVEHADEIFIDKLYFPKSERGKGYAKECFDFLERAKKDLILVVNRKNDRAVKCYLKNGFIIEKETETEVGKGLINCDYFMRKTVD